MKSVRLCDQTIRATASPCPGINSTGLDQPEHDSVFPEVRIGFMGHHFVRITWIWKIGTRSPTVEDYPLG